ncbi:hypothetical protein [Streptomyces sp. sk2.1]|uniref:hypothetical protein n=1 Tax=Streptomyces sp. sk2.1 TaxID=2478959 RepID=UPI0011E867D6|nr:hypothetical protein [Streptomyces sp. sk2.1]TXS65379.1 hypothetical protein EAO76_37745 [Streptomyces sp. sk2.1]
MDAIQQHMFDSYRAARLGEAPPPEPGRHDWAVVRGIRDHRRFEAVIAGRPARGRLRAALRAVLRTRAARDGAPVDRPGTPDRPGMPDQPGTPGRCGA